MNFKALPLVLSIACAAGATTAFAETTTPKPSDASHKVGLQEIRNATVKISYGGTTFLIDPMLAKKGAYPGFENTYRSNLRNPLVDLAAASKVLSSAYGCICIEKQASKTLIAP